MNDPDPYISRIRRRASNWIRCCMQFVSEFGDVSAVTDLTHCIQDTETVCALPRSFHMLRQNEVRTEQKEFKLC